MVRLRHFLLMAAMSAGLLLPVNHALAQRGGRGGGGGGGGRGGGGGGGGRGGGGQQQPPQQQQPPANPAVAQDKTDIAADQTALNDINTKLTEATTKFTDDYQKTQEYLDAQKAVDDATKGVQTARDDAINKIKDKPEYKDAAAKETAANAKLAQMRDNGASRDAIADQATIILNLGGVTSKMERAALEADSGYKDAQKKLADATATLNDLKSKMTEQEKTDDTISGLRTQQADAQSKLKDAQAKLSADMSGKPPPAPTTPAAASNP